MNLNEVITRLDAIATERYPMITELDIEALKIAMDIVKEKESTIKNDLGVDKLLAGCEKMSFEIEIFNKPLRVVALDAVKNIVKGLPSVTPQEPKTGHWIFVGEENEEETKAGNFRYVCSECGFSDVHGKSIYVPYCWQCGAKMAEPGESEEV